MFHLLPILAQAESQATLGGTLVPTLVSLLTLALVASQWVKNQTGKGSERQIEPTQISAIQAEMKQQTATLTKLDREMGEAKAGIKAVDEKVEKLSGDHARETENVFRRINAISNESAVTARRLDDHLADHRKA